MTIPPRAHLLHALHPRGRRRERVVCCAMQPGRGQGVAAAIEFTEACPLPSPAGSMKARSPCRTKLRAAAAQAMARCWLTMTGPLGGGLRRLVRAARERAVSARVFWQAVTLPVACFARGPQRRFILAAGFPAGRCCPGLPPAGRCAGINLVHHRSNRSAFRWNFDFRRRFTILESNRAPPRSKYRRRA